MLLLRVLRTNHKRNFEEYTSSKCRRIEKGKQSYRGKVQRKKIAAVEHKKESRSTKQSTGSENKWLFCPTPL